MKTKNRIWYCPLIVMGLVLIFATDCKKEEPAKLPVLSTTFVDHITKTTARSGGDITSDGGASISAYGVCWSTTSNPSITDSKTVDGIDSSHFVSSLSGLTEGTTYHVRAYATNSEGTAYGLDLPFTTYKSNAIPDNDGNYYNSVTIGSQVWMVENLKTIKYRNGDLIGTTTPVNLDITAEAVPKYQWAYDGNEGKVADYGRLYTWYAVTDIRNVCPAGWHIPSREEWHTLITFLGGEDVAGGKLKETSTTHWTIPNLGATNEFGFTALPGGSRDEDGTFAGIYLWGFWWSSTETSTTEAYLRYMQYSITNAGISPSYKQRGSSVRCLRD